MITCICIAWKCRCPEKNSSCSLICERHISVDVPSIAPTEHSSLVHGHRSSLYSFIVGHTTFPGRLHTFGRSDLSKSTTNSYAIYNTTNKPKARTHEGPLNIYQIIGPVHWLKQVCCIFWTLFSGTVQYLSDWWASAFFLPSSKYLFAQQLNL
jgi:hypothetical protein